jgi:hypothetical protein
MERLIENFLEKVAQLKKALLPPDARKQYITINTLAVEMKRNRKANCFFLRFFSFFTSLK